MKSFTTSQFWKHYEALPQEIRERADRAYKLWELNPQARGLYFKRVGKRQPVYSVRIDRGYRDLGYFRASQFYGSGLEHTTSMSDY